MLLPAGGRPQRRSATFVPQKDDSDEAVLEVVRLVLEKDLLVNASRIPVGVRNALIRLTGMVSSGDAREMAELDVWSMLGVDKVDNVDRLADKLQRGLDVKARRSSARRVAQRASRHYAGVSSSGCRRGDTMIYTGPLIDAHHHFWDVGMGRHPWLVPAPGHEMVFGDPSPLYRDYLPADLEADARSQNLVASVHVEAGWDRSDPLGETAWLSQLARTQRLPTVLVVYAPLDDPNVGAVLEAQSACPLVRGVRFVLSWHEDPGKSFVARADYMVDRQWLEGFALLAQFGLSFDLMLYPGQMADAARLAARFPEILILVNHAGSPVDRDEEGMNRWRRGLRSLASQPNVRIKISDLVAYDHDWTLESLRPIVLECIEAFGTDRAMFASDFPVAGLHATYDQVFDSFKTIVAELTPAEQRRLFHDNAQRDYRITVDSTRSTSS